MAATPLVVRFEISMFENLNDQHFGALLPQDGCWMSLQRQIG